MKKIISLLLVVIVIISFVSVTAFATDTKIDYGDIVEDYVPNFSSEDQAYVSLGKYDPREKMH